jgi:pyocin large subunit-like protein
MSIDAIRWAWTIQGLRPAQKLILLSLADRADEQHMCWPSLRRISHDTGLDERTITTSLQRMCEAGIISRVETPGKGYTYTLLGVSGREDTPLKNGGAKTTPLKNDPPQKCSIPPSFLQSDPPPKM